MPSRRTILLILAFWAATLGFVAYRDVWPRIAASGPPPVVLDLEDEARPNYQVTWRVYRNGQKAGRLDTTARYIDDGDQYQFTHHYMQLDFDFPGMRVVFPDVITHTWVGRTGGLRRQSIKGKMIVQIERRKGNVVEYDPLSEAEAKMEGRVENGVFRGTVEIESPLLSLKRDLDPVAVPAGQVLNPLQPVNRITNVRPGQSWNVQQVDPLGEAATALGRKVLGNIGLPEEERVPLLARVASEAQLLSWGEADVPCWVIEYTGGEYKAKTWVRVSDGRVLRQEAFHSGEHLSLNREELP